MTRDEADQYNARIKAANEAWPWRDRPRTGPNNCTVDAFADMSKDCTCKPRDWRAYADDDGSAFDCPHHGHFARFGYK
jgi:hypothetical protein